MTNKQNQNPANKKLKLSYSVEQKHWVGDGFHVHGMLRPTTDLIPYISPFILLDYASPRKFPASNQRRGVGEHPHRGFETVTFAFQGEIEHRDSSGGGGVINPGGVQWMTAGKGIVHDEFHSHDFTKTGGDFEMVQLWVNLPKKYKLVAPRYQSIDAGSIPKFAVADGAEVHVVAGDYLGSKGPAATHSPINIYRILSKNNSQMQFNLSQDTNTVILIMAGSLVFDGQRYDQLSLLIFDQPGTRINFECSPGFKALLLNGEPINETMVAHGPFIMNTEQEIIEAIGDYQNGKMGRL